MRLDGKHKMGRSQYRWVIVAAGGLLGCVAIGAMFSLPVFLRPISRDTGWSITGISSAMTFGFLAMALGSIVWGNLSDRFGPRLIVLIGSCVLATALALASRATSLIEFQLIFGLLVGGAAAALFAPMIMSPLAARLISNHDWRTSFQILAAVTAVVMIPVALLVRRPPALESEDIILATHEEPQSGITLGQGVRSPQFLPLLLTNFFCCATHSGPIFHTVSYAITCGIPLVAAVSIYSVEGLAGLGGRVAFGFLGDRFGAKRVLVSGLLLQAFGALAYFFVRHLGAFYAVAALFGFIYAGVMPLYAVLARENFPLRMMGTIIGGTAMAGSLGMATGPLAGGLIYDTFASYGWLYLGAWGMGIGAFLIALTFRPYAAKSTPEPAGAAG